MIGKIIRNKILGVNLNAQTNIYLHGRRSLTLKKALPTAAGIILGAGAGVVLIDQISPIYQDLPNFWNAFKVGTALLGVKLEVVYFGWKAVVQKVRLSNLIKTMEKDAPNFSDTLEMLKGLSPDEQETLLTCTSKKIGSSGPSNYIKGLLDRDAEQAEVLGKKEETPPPAETPKAVTKAEEPPKEAPKVAEEIKIEKEVVKDDPLKKKIEKVIVELGTFRDKQTKEIEEIIKKLKEVE